MFQVWIYIHYCKCLYEIFHKTKHQLLYLLGIFQQAMNMMKVGYFLSGTLKVAYLLVDPLF